MTDEAPARESRQPGCFFNAMLLGCLALAGGTYLLHKWDALPGAGKAGGIVLVVLGTLLVLPFILFLAFKLFIRRLLGKAAADLKAAAAEVDEEDDNVVANKDRFTRLGQHSGQQQATVSIGARVP